MDFCANYGSMDIADPQIAPNRYMEIMTGSEEYVKHKR